jgi:hypothetical protein
MSVFQTKLAQGKVGEGIVATYLRGRGYNILPVYEIEKDSDKGPVVYTTSGMNVAPDMLCFRAVNVDDTSDKLPVVWVEAKTKSSFSWHMNTSCWTTGIDLRHYGEYRKLAEQSPFPIWLMFLQLDGVAKDTPPGMTAPTGLFGNSLEYLAAHEHHRSEKWGRSGMVYWDHRDLKLIATEECL